MEKTKEGRNPFNLQVRIEDALKVELGTLAAAFACYPKKLVNEALAHYLPIKRRELNRKANGKH